MTIIYKGVRRKTTDVLDDYGQAFYAQNWRFKRLGEIGRRPGIGKSNMARLTGPVRAMICDNLYFPYLVQVNDAGDVEATLNPIARWTDPVMDIPDGEVGQPSAPIIVSVTANPATGAYVVGDVTMTAVVSYDGLSGPLIYDWENYTVTPGGTPLLLNDAINPTTYTFDGSCIPGTYSNPGIGLTVSTTLNGFSTTASIPDFTVT